MVDSYLPASEYDQTQAAVKLQNVTQTQVEDLCSRALATAGAAFKTKVIAISAAPTGSEQDTTWDLPSKAVVLDVFINVTTAEVTGTTKTLDVGLLSSESGGDADGFLKGVSVATTGVKRAGATLDGTNNWFLAGTRGALLARTVAGANADDRGLYVEFPHVSTSVTARSVSYTSASANFAEFRGSIIIVYVEIG